MKNKLLFFAKCILVLLPVIALVGFTLLCPLCYMDEEYPSWRYTQSVTSAESDGVHTLILGDSRAMANLIPDYLGDDCINLAVGGATPVEMYYFYKRYLKSNPAPATTVVMFAPFHYSYIDNYKTRTTYFNALTVSEQAELISRARDFDADAILFENYQEYDISARLRMPDVYLPAMLNARLIGRYSDNKALLEKITAAKGQGYFGMLDGCDGIASEAGYTAMGTDGNRQLIDYYFELLLEELDKSGTQVILEQPPMNAATYELLDEGYVSEYASYIDEKCREHNNIVYSTKLTEYGNEYFGDPSHLNEKGAVKFSEEFHTRYKDLL